MQPERDKSIFPVGPVGLRRSGVIESRQRRAGRRYWYSGNVAQLFDVKEEQDAEESL